MSKVAFCLCIYGASNLLKIGVIIYSNVIALKLKYCSVCIYDCSPHPCSTFNGVPWFLLLHGDLSWELTSHSWETTCILGSPEEDIIAVLAQAMPVTVLLSQPVNVGKKA